MDSELNFQSYGHPNSFNNQQLEKENRLNEKSSSIVDNSNKNYYRDDYKYSIQHDPNCSFSTPPSISQQTIDPTERIQFLREMEQTREELAEFRRNMAGLVKQMDGIAVDLEKSKDRVFEIEQDLTATEEVNVNLQVLLERAVKTQKESDIFTTQAIRNMYSDLALVVYENNQLQGRLKLIENHQKEQKGNVHDIVKRIFEYTQMLEQAQGTIHMLQEPNNRLLVTSRRNSEISLLYNTDDDYDYYYDYDNDDNDSLQHITTNTVTTATSNRKLSSNYIQSPPLGPQLTKKPQQGLRMLFDNGGISSLAKK